MKSSRGCGATFAACFAAIVFGAVDARADGDSGSTAHAVARRGGLMGASNTEAPASGAKAAPPPAALPGFADSPGIYHEASKDFFLSRSEELGLSDRQYTQLEGIHARSERRQAEAERKIDKAEEELWALTAVSSPDVQAIAAKIAEITQIESLRRMAFIRDVGDAARVLSKEQRAQVVKGTTARPAPAAPRSASPSASAPPQATEAAPPPAKPGPTRVPASAKPTPAAAGKSKTDAASAANAPRADEDPNDDPFAP